MIVDVQSALLDEGGAGFYLGKKHALYATNERSIAQEGHNSF
jgi:hypothetical protein